MRLRAEIWVRAYLRACEGQGANALVLRHGDDDAGAVFIKTLGPDGMAEVFGPAPAGLDDVATERRWARHAIGTPASPGPHPEAVADAYLDQQARFDPDVWALEVADRKRRHFLDDWLVAASG